MRTRLAVRTSVALWAALVALAVAMPLVVGASRFYQGLGSAAVGGRVSDPTRAAGWSSVKRSAAPIIVTRVARCIGLTRMN